MADRRAHVAIETRQLGQALEDSPHTNPVTLEQPEGLARFRRALAELAGGRARRVRVLVFGSSNVAGDRFPGYMRGFLQQRFGDAGPGFVSAAPLWRWHRHQEVRVSSRGFTVSHDLKPGGPRGGRFGLLGARAIARGRGARARVRLADGLGPAERWELWYDTGPWHGRVTATLDGGSEITVDTRAAERAPGYASLPAIGGHRELEVRHAGGGGVTLFGVLVERDAPGVVVDTLGIGGSGARRVLRWDRELWAAHLRRRDPALVILAYGGIESMRREHDPLRFTAEMGQILERVAQAVPAADCLIVGPSDRAYRRGPRGARRVPAILTGVVEILRTVARERGCAFFDARALMGGDGAVFEWVAAGLVKPDHVHLTARGNALLGRAVVDAMLDRGGAGE